MPVRHPEPQLAQARNRASHTGFGLGSGSAPLEILPADYEAFERLLGEIQDAWSNEDVARLHTLATPEMVSYFTKDLEANRARNVVNKISDTKLLQGDLAEAWREGDTDFASVAMRFSMVDKTIDRASGRLVEGSEAADRSDGSVDLPAAARRQLGTLGDPADLKVGQVMMMQGAAVRSAAPLSLQGGFRQLICGVGIISCWTC